MANEVQNMNIVIYNVEDAGEQIKIRDQNRQLFSFFKQKKDGTPTAAFTGFQQFAIGDTVEISYKEVPYKNGTLKNITNIRQATGPAAPPSPRPPQRIREEKPSRHYWEQREAQRQSSIVMQVAFKAAVELQVAGMQPGAKVNLEELYATTVEFCDWLLRHMSPPKTTSSDGEAEPFEG